MKQRIATAAVLIPLVLLIVGATSPIPISIAAMGMAAIGVYELAGMVGGKRVLPILTLLSLALPFYSVFIAKSHQLAEFLPISFGFLLVAISVLYYSARKQTFTSSVVDLGGLWVSMPMLALIALHEVHLAAYGHIVRPTFRFETPVLLALLPVWAGDTAAIFAGKAFGKHKLSSISPGKTVEGAVANLIAAALVGWATGLWVGVSLPIALTCGVLAGTLGQAGDLFQSYLKRRAGVKDSGRLLPGHGGLLDRIDSVLFVAVPVAIVVYFGPTLLYRLHDASNPPTPKDIRIDQKGARIAGSS